MTHKSLDFFADLNGTKIDKKYNIFIFFKENILITPFKNKIIPPPMSLHKLSCPSPVNSLAWSHTGMHLAALLSINEIQFYTEKKGELDALNQFAKSFKLKN